jgi:hypothetical protein
MTLRLKKRGEKALERALSHSTPVENPPNSKRWKGPEDLPISEEVEPTTPSAREFQHDAQRRKITGTGNGNDTSDLI